MSAFRKAMSGAAVVSVLSIAGLGLNSLEAGAQEGGAEEAVDPSVEPQGTPVVTTTAAAKATTTTATGGNLGSVGAATTVAGATTTAAPTTTKVQTAGAGGATTAAPKVGAAEEQLPVTGSDVGAPIKLGVALGALGVGALLIARRRRPSAA